MEGREVDNNEEDIIRYLNRSANSRLGEGLSRQTWLDKVLEV